MQDLVARLSLPDVKPVFVTGAGISIASGIAPFRGTANAVWANTVLEKGTHAYFRKHTVDFWTWYLTQFPSTLDALPNAGHLALTRIESWLLARGRPCMTVTQNVDGLHGKAGTKNLVEVHGAARFFRCIGPGCKNGDPYGYVPRDESKVAAFLAKPGKDTLPRCECGARFRPHVLWFDEYYDGHASYRMGDVEQAFDGMNLIVFIGTSFSVGITAMGVMAAEERRVPVFVVDPHAQPQRGLATLYHEKAEVFLPALADALGAQSGGADA